MRDCVQKCDRRSCLGNLSISREYGSTKVTIYVRVLTLESNLIVGPNKLDSPVVVYSNSKVSACSAEGCAEQ